MTCITAGDGNNYCDGEYIGFCPSQKEQCEFDGKVSLTETDRVIATGLCACRTPLQVTLYTPLYTP